MADMVSILEELNKEIGIIGSIVVTPDGMVVASALGPDLDDETVAALASNATAIALSSLQHTVKWFLKT